MLTTYSSQLNIKKIRGIIFLGFLFWLIASPSSAFFHDKDKNETEVEITEDLYSQMQDMHVEAAAENLLIALETKADNQKHRWVKGSYEGYIIPFSTFINDLGYFCRDYVEVIVRNGSRYNVFENFACRDHDGEWVWIQTKSANKSERM
jgi:hypothetical protein